MAWTFNAPPGWPVPPGFVPPQGWVPDPEWPSAPQDWEFWVADVPAGPTVEAAPVEAAAPLVTTAENADPYRVPPPGSYPQPTAYPPPTAGYPGYPPPAGAPAYGAPGYGAPGYGAPGYGAPAYGAGAYGSSPASPRRGISGWLIAVIIGVVVLLIVAVVAGVLALGGFLGNTVGPLIKSDAACSDALDVIDGAQPPSKAEAQDALPDLKDSLDRARAALNDSPFVDTGVVVRPLERMIAGYEVYAELPADPSTWSPSQQASADQAATDIRRAYDDLDSFCGVGSEDFGGDTQQVGGSSVAGD